MYIVIAMLLLFVALGLIARKPDPRITFVMALITVSYICYAYASS